MICSVHMTKPSILVLLVSSLVGLFSCVEMSGKSSVIDVRSVQSVQERTDEAYHYT